MKPRKCKEPASSQSPRPYLFSNSHTVVLVHTVDGFEVWTCVHLHTCIRVYCCTGMLLVRVHSCATMHVQYNTDKNKVSLQMHRPWYYVQMYCCLRCLKILTIWIHVHSRMLLVCCTTKTNYQILVKNTICIFSCTSGWIHVAPPDCSYRFGADPYVISGVTSRYDVENTFRYSLRLRMGLDLRKVQ